jgi:hypothetical protein
LAVVICCGRCSALSPLRRAGSVYRRDAAAGAGIGAVYGCAGAVDGAGTFIAGVLLAESEYRHELEIAIDPFKGLLLGCSLFPSAWR